MVRRALATPSLLRAGASLLLWAGTAGAADMRAFTEAQYSSDSDDQVQRSFAVGFRQALPSVEASWAAAIGHRELSAPAGRENFEFARVDGKVDFWQGASLVTQVSQLHGGGWSPTLGTAAVHWKPDPRWYVEASGERDLVDTVVAIRNRVLIDTAALSVDWTPVPYLTIVAGASKSDFSDDNERRSRTLRIVYSPTQLPWLNAQVRLKRADSDAIGIGYFNPKRLEEYEFLLRVAGAPFGDRWNLSLQAGTGQQRIDGGSRSSIYSVDARARGWFTDHYGLEGRAACTNTGSLSASPADAGYRYCFVGATFLVAW
jgi:hypothetical protein